MNAQPVWRRRRFFATIWRCALVAATMQCAVARAQDDSGDLQEIEAASEEFLAVSDHAPLAAEEMPAYWRLMTWARERTFDELWKQSRGDILYTQLRQKPEAYRGKIVRLQLRLRRSLRHEAPQNRANVRQVYEAWGCTPESHPYPYLIVFSAPPPEFPLGATIDAEVSFAGYFLKSMAYESNGKKQGAPLLIGRVQWKPAQTALAPVASDLEWPWIVGIATGVGAIVGLAVMKRRHAIRMRALQQRSLPERLDLDEAHDNGVNVPPLFEHAPVDVRISRDPRE